jgi:hypothetical protein
LFVRWQVADEFATMIEMEEKRNVRQDEKGDGEKKEDLGVVKGIVDQRGQWKKKEEVFGKGLGGSRGSRSSRLLGFVFYLMMIDDDAVFHLRIGSVSDGDDDDGFWKNRRREESQKINLEGGL